MGGAFQAEGRGEGLVVRELVRAAASAEAGNRVERHE